MAHLPKGLRQSLKHLSMSEVWQRLASKTHVADRVKIRGHFLSLAHPMLPNYLTSGASEEPPRLPHPRLHWAFLDKPHLYQHGHGLRKRSEPQSLRSDGDGAEGVEKAAGEGRGGHH